MDHTNERDENIDGYSVEYSHVKAEQINQVLACLVSLGFHIDMRKEELGFPTPTKSARMGCQKIYFLDRDELSAKYVIFNCGHHPDRVHLIAAFDKKILSALDQQDLSAKISRELGFSNSTIVYKADLDSLIQKAVYESDFSDSSFKTFVNSFNEDHSRLKLLVNSYGIT
jgi:hypothetical protein